MGFCWGTLLVVVSAAVLGVYALNQVNSQLRLHVLKELEKQLPDLHIDLGSVQLDEQKGISIRRLECSTPDRPGRPGRRLLFADDVYLECPVTPHALYKREVNVRKIVLRDPIVRLTRSVDGEFDDLKYFRTSGKSNTPAPIEIFGGTLIYEDLALNNDSALKLDEIHLTLQPPGAKEKQSVDSNGKPTTSHESQATIPANAWTITGRAKSDRMRQASAKGFYAPPVFAAASANTVLGDKNKASWAVSFDCRQLDWTPELLDYLRLSKPVEKNPDLHKTLQSFQGRFDLSGSASSDDRFSEGLAFELAGILSHGRAELFHADRTLSEIDARFRVNNEEIVVDKLTGIAEAARFMLNYSQTGLKKPVCANLSANIRGLYFDAKLVKALSPFLNHSTQTLLARFDYTGTTDLDAVAVLNNGSWKPNALTLNISNLNFSFYDFPYKITGLSGDFKVDSSAALNFQLAGNREHPLKPRIIGRYSNIFNDPVGQVEVWGQDVPIDTKLFASLPEDHRSIIQSLHPEGKVNAYLKIELPPNDLPLKKHFEIGLNNVSVQYEKFPYPLRKIDGLIRLDDANWSFENLIGTNESARVTGTGHLKPVLVQHPNQPGATISTTELLLSLQAKELPVDGQLSDALLDAGQRELLTGLRAKGKINLDASIRYYASDSKLNLDFCAIPCPEFSIRPERFPYRIDNLSGEIFYRNGLIFSRQLTGNNRDMKLSSGVHCRVTPGGSWMLQLNPLTLEQISPNRELQDALPTNLQQIVQSLQIEKPFNMKGYIEFIKGGEKAPLQTIWDSTAILHQNNANIGAPIQNIFGEIRLTGFAQDNDFRLAGELKLDSLIVRGVQATQVKGPFFYDGVANQTGFQQLHIGQPALKALLPPPDYPQLKTFRQSPWFAENRQPRPIGGKLCDGELYGLGIVLIGNNISYSVNTHLVGADLSKLASELDPKASKISGKLNLQANFRGDGRKMETLASQGKIELRDANIYEAPGMLRLLRELSIRETDPNAGAFTSADINYNLQGNRVFLDPIIFEGAAFSLSGNGEMRLDTRHVHLTMKTRLGNRKTYVPIVTNILGGAGDQLVQLSIEGPITDPTVRQVPFPEFQKIIRNVQSDDMLEEEQNNTQTPSVGKPARRSPQKSLPWR